MSIHSLFSSKLTHQIKVLYSLFYLQTWSLGENCQVSWTKNLNIYEETKNDGLNLNLIKHLIKTNTRYEYLGNRMLDTQTSNWFQTEAVVFMPICASGYLPLISPVKNQNPAKCIKIKKGVYFTKIRKKINETRFITMLW